MRFQMSDNRGFTLVEMIVVMAVFIVVLIITGSTLKTLLDKGIMTQRSEESNTEGVVGLEILRHDLQQAGLGLFTDVNSAPTFTEAAGAPYSSYNDANSVPRPIVTDNNLTVSGVLTGTDYLAIKGTTLALSSASQLWSYVDDTGVPKRWGRDDFTDLNDKVIVIEQKLDTSKNMMVRRLVQVAAGNYGVSYYASGAFEDQGGNPVTDYTPSTTKINYLYGIDTMDTGVATFTLRAPFNRADYFINRDVATTPASCSPAAGVLFKAVMNQVDGTFDQIPILDCVADMQIILGWNTSEEPEKSNEVQGYSDAAIPATYNDPEEVQKRLRLVMVYLLVQDGRRDSNFINTNSAMIIGDKVLDPSGNLTKSVDLTSGDFQNYRWKLHRVVVRPKNLF